MDDPGLPPMNSPRTPSLAAQHVVYDRSSVSPKGSPRNVVAGRRVSPRSSAKTPKDSTSLKPAIKNTTLSAVATKPILPAAERRMHGDVSTTRRRKGSEADKWDVPSDGREGRQFTVGNVGNNGRIYLRPTVRPANQRYAPPNTTLPLTPPATAGLENFSPTKTGRLQESDSGNESWTTMTGFATRDPEYDTPDASTSKMHRRAASESTVQEATQVKDLDEGALKIVISKPLEERRPRTMEELDPNELPLLDVKIPHWRLGTPRFTMMGTPLIQGTSCTPTEEIPSTRVSAVNHSNASIALPMPTMVSRNSTVGTMPRLASTYSGHGLSSRFLPILPMPRPMRSTYMSTFRVIEPAMFDDLTFKPACDEKSIVRYSSTTGAVIAATPPRLVAEITSPSFLDYELISDFFLTFRAFLEPGDLLRMLIARLKWAVARNDEIGMIVRVRTFVALRHWILNYFMDDFVVDYPLRVTFCNLLNDFVSELAQDLQVRKVQLKILGELKKCWRRVCAHYWDGPSFDDALGAEAPIAPGGIAGHRDPELNPNFWKPEDNGPPKLDSPSYGNSRHGGASFYADIARAGHNESSFVAPRPETPLQQVAGDVEQEFGHTSPISLVSMDIVSCSFPGKSIRQYPSHPLAAHPVMAYVPPQPEPVATTPKALTGKRVHPAHKRDNSLSDSSRDHGSDKMSFKDKEFLMTAPFAGSLVRGNLLPPSQAFVDVASSGADTQRQTTVFRPEDENIFKGRAVGGAMSAYGMRRLMMNVRKALRARPSELSSPTPATLTSVFPSGSRGATTNRLPGTAVVPQGRPRQDGARPPVRIDLLGAEVAEDFNKAIREDEAAEAAQNGLAFSPPELESTAIGNVEYSAAHMESFSSSPVLRRQASPSSDMALTLGSKSIVIVDATSPLDGLTAPDAQPTVRQSGDTFADLYLPHVADPTPPNTPPARGTPRRSSYLLNQHVMHHPLDELPPFVPDWATLSHSPSDRPSFDSGRPSPTATRQAPRYTSFNRVTFQKHGRNRSTRTQQSLNSILHRRHASFGSGMPPAASLRSFDASTHYTDSIMGARSEVSMPQPLRILRRRPGGDLRAATKTEDLGRLTRSKSVGSLTTYSESLRGSFLQTPPESAQHLDDNHLTQSRQDVFSVGQLAEVPPKSKISLFSTHSSKPIMRPSFEAEALKLAQIPDDDDDGGIESALLKLEGKFTKKPSKPESEPEYVHIDDGKVDPRNTLGRAVNDVPSDKKEKTEHRHLHVNEEFISPEAQDDDEVVTSTTPGGVLDVPGRPVTEALSFLSEATRESYSSIPLLERGLLDDARSRRASRHWANKSILHASDDEVGLEDDAGSPSSGPDASRYMSFTFIQKTDSMEGIKAADRGSTDVEEQSFLNDDSGSDTDLSTDLSTDGLEFGNPEDRYTFSHKSTLPKHPFGEPSPQPDRGPTPLLSPVSQENKSPVDDHGPKAGKGAALSQLNFALTPESTPPVPQSRTMDGKSTSSQAPPSKHGVDISRNYSVHLPFILAFDSEILAQQFTLIEKDALNEIDWKELIDLGWKNSTNNDARSWVDFLRNVDAHGVEVVIARFNIMVKWAVSQIVLTQHIEERAKCIIKFIHIAAHCRRYRNFATLAQLTIALTSNEVDRLGRTWALVPEQDHKTLRDLEMLVTPTRNFYSLRAEMEIGSDSGCIPFVGIYTHDLLYNAQRPSEIASSPTTAPLINFERCRIAAVVVKTLLRLLEASTRYVFQPVEGITERCLWIGALSNQEIRQRSEALE
ncbi:hypothetical protein S40288_00627 [Stachybotrys chartarum IBT 40288]|nr:hypothetical protein S40288_00627 [Stachybotrys chartarum IBT 40288]